MSVEIFGCLSLSSPSRALKRDTSSLVEASAQFDVASSGQGSDDKFFLNAHVFVAEFEVVSQNFGLHTIIPEEFEGVLPFMARAHREAKLFSLGAHVMLNKVAVVHVESEEHID